jgi:hypothetical protein
VDIPIGNGTDYTFANECSIIKNEKFEAVRKWQEDYFMFVVDWDIEGWGASDDFDSNYAEIVGLYFEHDALRLSEASVSYRALENGSMVNVETVWDVENIHHKLDSFISARSSLRFIIKVGKGDVDGPAAFISDNLIMEYTMNGEPQIYKVNLRNVHLANHIAVFQHFFSNNCFGFLWKKKKAAYSEFLKLIL